MLVSIWKHQQMTDSTSSSLPSLSETATAVPFTCACCFSSTKVVMISSYKYVKDKSKMSSPNMASCASFIASVLAFESPFSLAYLQKTTATDIIDKLLFLLFIANVSIKR